jgi:hypothetical protein
MALSAIPCANAVETKASGRVTFGSVYRTEANDATLMTAVNAAALGLPGFAGGGNADDGNLNYRKGDATSTALKAYLDLSAREGGFAALVRIKAWRDFGLLNDARPWGNAVNGYAPDQPLGDAGAPRLSRFSGIALGEAWVEQSLQLGGMRVLGRAGQQTLDWGARSGMPGGLEAISARDLPALHRAGAAPQETKVAMPMLFARVEPAAGFGIEGYYQTKFTPNALDVCGTVWSVSDYMTQGCDRVMTGQPLVSDRARIPLGAYQKRLPTPKPEAAEFGIGATWKSVALGADLGLYHARYNSRIPMPGLRRSTRSGPAMIAGDPDGKNMAYFTEYPERLAISALTFAVKRGATSVYGEVSYRRNQPFMLSPSDVVPPFLSPAIASLLRADVDATPPGGLFHGYDSYSVAQAQIGVQHEWRPAGVPLTAAIEAVGKHAVGLPDPTVRRYNRADVYGPGPVFGVCTAGSDPLRQCTARGYATPDAWAYRLRLDARFAAVLPGLDATASAMFNHDLKGWSGDFLINEGRKTANVALRFEYRQRYLAEISYLPTWGGDYNVTADRDTLALAVGVRF